LRLQQPEVLQSDITAQQYLSGTSAGIGDIPRMSAATTAGRLSQGAAQRLSLGEGLLDEHSCRNYSIVVYYSNEGDRSMTQYSTSDLSRKSGDIIAEALRRPVTITQRNKPRLVLLSIEDYRKLTARAETRKAGRLETMPDELFEDVKQAVDAYEREGDDT
jgi:prevent-host-death family protein